MQCKKKERSQQRGAHQRGKGLFIKYHGLTNLPWGFRHTLYRTFVPVQPRVCTTVSV